MQIIIIINLMGMFSLLTRGTKGELPVLTKIFNIQAGLFDSFFAACEAVQDSSIIINGCVLWVLILLISYLPSLNCTMRCKWYSDI